MLVLILPAVLLAVMAVVQLALAYHARQVVTAAAQDAAFAATAAGAAPDTATTTANAVVGTAGRGLVRDVTIDVTDNGDRTHVEVNAIVANVVPGLSIRVSGTAESPREMTRPQAAP